MGQKSLTSSVIVPTMSDPSPKPKVTRRRKREPVVIIVSDGVGGSERLELEAPDEFTEALKASEAQVLENLGDLVDDDNENAATTACVRLLDAIQDKSTPELLRSKLSKHKMKAFRRLLCISTGGDVAAARANASAYIVKLQKVYAPAAWPPNTNDPAFKERLQKAEEMCKLKVA